MTWTNGASLSAAPVRSTTSQVQGGVSPTSARWPDEIVRVSYREPARPPKLRTLPVGRKRKNVWILGEFVWKNDDVVHSASRSSALAAAGRPVCEARRVDRTLRRLYPEPAADILVADAYGAPDRSPPAGRPWVMITMVSSVDGSSAIGGKSGPLGNAADAAVLSATRAAADVIVVGATTVRVEGYGPPRHPDTRIGVVTATGALDTSSPLFSSGAGFVIMPESGPDLAVPTLRIGERRVDAAPMLARLHELAGPVGVVQVEGGPTVNGWLVHAGCVDEVNLTLSPRVAGGTGPRPVVGAGTGADLDLAHLLVDDEGFVFSRWTTRR